MGLIYTHALTRKELIDSAACQNLEKQLRKIKAWGKTAEINLPAGISDYVLYRENGKILAAVEEKK